MKSKPSRQPSIRSKGIAVGQSTLKETLERGQKYERKGKKWKELTDAVTYYIAKDSLPVYSVEKPGFKRLLNTMDNRYEVPGRFYFTRTAIPALYATTRDTVKQELSTIKYFSATTDLWSSQGMVPYISYTVHFIDSSTWKLKSRCLQTQFLPEDHTGENLAEAFLSALDSWDLKADQQVCLSTDNGSNIVNAAERLGWTRLSCFGLNLHLAITKSLKNDRRCVRAIGVSQKIVSSFSSSWKRKRELTKAQINLGLKQHSLVTVNYCIINVLIKFNDNVTVKKE